MGQFAHGHSRLRVREDPETESWKRKGVFSSHGTVHWYWLESKGGWWRWFSRLQGSIRDDNDSEEKLTKPNKKLAVNSRKAKWAQKKNYDEWLNGIIMLTKYSPNQNDSNYIGRGHGIVEVRKVIKFSFSTVGNQWIIRKNWKSRDYINLKICTAKETVNRVGENICKPYISKGVNIQNT